MLQLCFRMVVMFNSVVHVVNLCCFCSDDCSFLKVEYSSVGFLVKCVLNKLERKRTTSEMMGTAEEGGDTIEWIDEKFTINLSTLNDMDYHKEATVF